MASLWKFAETNMKQTEKKKKERKGIWMRSSLQVLSNLESYENKAVSFISRANLVGNWHTQISQDIYSSTVQIVSV